MLRLDPVLREGCAAEASRMAQGLLDAADLGEGRRHLGPAAGPAPNHSLRPAPRAVLLG